jgi:hypothetical protein
VMKILITPADVALNFQICTAEVLHVHARACKRYLILLPFVQ